MAEHGIAADDAVIGVVFDGTGYGDDGAIWGGEVFVGGYASVRRVAHLATTPLPAGDVDVRHGARLALAHLAGGGRRPGTTTCRACSRARRPSGRCSAQRVAHAHRHGAVEQHGPPLRRRRLAARRAPCLGLRGTGRHGTRGPGAAAPTRPTPIRAYAFALSDGGRRDAAGSGTRAAALVEDLRPAWPRRTGGALPRRRRRAPCSPSCATRAPTRRRSLSSGCPAGVFQNVRCWSGPSACSERDGFRVLTHRLVPPNDGGLSLGQAIAGAHGRLGQPALPS